MKILDKYIIKNFLVPFFATFFIVLFVLIMQALWWAFNDIAGKDIDLIFILKYLGYIALIVTPTALPIGVLLSSIMAMGNFSEKYEFAAAKSAGVSLKRLMRPLVFLILLISGISFLFLNNVYPYAIFKQRNLFLNMKKQKPALALVAGSFNNEIPGYSIKFDEKYGPDENKLKNVLIYDLRNQKGTTKIIRAKNGQIKTEEGSRYMTLVLNDGFYFEDHINRRRGNTKRENMPASTATFDKYTINIDISSFSDNNMELEKFKGSYTMLNINQLKKGSDSLKIKYDRYLQLRANEFLNNSKGDHLYAIADSLRNTKLGTPLLKNFDEKTTRVILNSAIENTRRQINSISRFKESFKNKRRYLNNFDFEFHYRIAFSLSCLLLFFVGAPLGSIIRKGGFGLPMVLAILIFVAYFFSNAMAKNIAEESTIPTVYAGWISSCLLLPLGIFLTRRATKGIGLFNINVFLRPVTKRLKYFRKTK